MRTLYFISFLFFIHQAFAQESYPPKVNYDESKVPNYELSDLLTCKDGTEVKTVKDWEQKRRPEIMDGKEKSPHSVLHFDLGNQFAVRSGDWKLIYNPVDPSHPRVKQERIFLSNLRKDPSEKHNYTSEYPEKVEELMSLRKEYVESIK